MHLGAAAEADSLGLDTVFLKDALGDSDIERREGDGLRVSGELDMGSAPELEAIVVRLCELGSNHLTLDLSNVTFIDSTGLQAVIDARNRCAQHKQEFRIIPGPPSVQRIFEITGLLESLPFESDAAPSS